MAKRGILYIAAEYRADEVREKKHEHNFEARHASGYFDRVISVHPVADLVGAEKGRIHLIRFTKRQLVVEGVSELYRLPRWLLPLNFLLSQGALLRVLKRLVHKQDVGVVAATDPFLSGLLAWALSRMTGKPLMIRIGGNYEELHREAGALAMPRLIPSYRLQQAIGRFVMKRADLVAGNNRNNLGWAIANGARRHTAIIPISGNIQRVHMIPPEDRTRGEETFARLGIPFGHPTLLYVGRLLKLKQPDEALKAMALVVEQEPTAIGILAGAGPMQAELEKLADRLGIRSRIYFIGQTTQEDLSEIIPYCVTVSPLTGLSLIECGLGGSPPVGYNRDWQGEFIEDGVNGYIVPDHDYRAMADRLLQILRDPLLKANLSKAIRERSLRQMDADEVRRLEKEAFDKILVSQDGEPIARY
ncbi:glycosyltransferase [Sphingomonas daechungensis]|uniref:glycosyltransferase n=1 Tax=Sphingomonas daechungensis TaxID=1176646 RepID=UPI003784521D